MLSQSSPSATFSPMSKQASSNEQLSFAARSDVGMKRAMNQDAFEASISQEAWEQKGHRFVVADGMGAHAAGELASQLAVEEVSKQYDECELPPEEAIVSALQAANSVIHQRGQSDPQLFNMGTTCSSLVILPQGALVAHVGDSRVYRCREDKIQQLTFDHSLVWEMRAAGQIRGDDRAAAIPRNVITRCLGPHAEVIVDTEGFFSVRPGDTFLLCSDGLTGRISDKEIGTIIRYLDPDEAVDLLTDLANLRGGSDNITTIITRIVGGDLRADGDVSDALLDNSSGGTHPLWWIIAGCGLIAALAGFQFAMLPAALTGCALFLVGTVGALYQWWKSENQSNNSTMPTAPYASAAALVDSEFIAGVSETFRSILAALLPSMPELQPFSAEIEALQQATETNDGSQLASSDSKRICQQMAKIAMQLRSKI